ncbi:alpha/beta fold hydrolase [Mesorhizobium sp. M0026]|uniref:alpha/beta fold hydrolase n=1 Tax=Mesorhizobium sp. M0026 TaxID=2956847 RepID=UPI00333C5D94
MDGVNLFDREAGRRDAPGVLLLHGQPSSSYSFRDVINPLAEVARVVAPDLPGFSFTEAPEDYPYTLEALAQTIDPLKSCVCRAGDASCAAAALHPHRRRQAQLAKRGGRQARSKG